MCFESILVFFRFWPLYTGKKPVVTRNVPAVVCLFMNNNNNETSIVPYVVVGNGHLLKVRYGFRIAFLHTTIFTTLFTIYLTTSNVQCIVSIQCQ